MRPNAGRSLRQWTDKHRAASAALLVLLPLASAFFCLSAGRYETTLGETARVLWAHLSGGESALACDGIIWNGRVPRMLLALAAGGGLAAAGVAFQSLFCNPLATPDTLGAASGASFGAALGLLLGWSMTGVQLLALGTGLCAVGLTFALGRSRETGDSTVVLAGVVLSALFSALVSLVKYAADVDSQLPAITYWLMGTLSGAGWKRLAVGLPLLLLGMLGLALLRWRLNLLTLSPDEARSCGARLGILRGAAAVCASAITASAVSMCGQVGWVGLLIPHLCRMLFGSDNAKLIPASLCLGAAFLAIVDTLARSLTASELPISILTALLGAPVFLLLLRRTGGWKL